MSQVRARRFAVLVVMLLAVGCEGRSPTSPSSPPSASPPPPALPSTGLPPNPSRSFEVTGIVTDDTGAPVPDARVAIWDDYADLPVVRTDNTGRYTLKFSGVPGSNHYPEFDPADTRDAVAFVTVEAPGYEPYARFVLGTSEQLVEHIRLRRVQRVAAGESAILTISPDDSVCVIDAWPGRESICRTLHVSALTDGSMSVEAVPDNAASGRPALVVYGNRTGAPRGNPTAIEVSAGNEYTVHVELTRPFSESQSFVVKTSMQRFRSTTTMTGSN